MKNPILTDDADLSVHLGLDFNFGVGLAIFGFEWQ